MEPLQAIPQHVDGILETFRSLRVDLHDHQIGLTRKKLQQIVRNQSDGADSNLKNYLVGIQQVAEHCGKYWNGHEERDEGYVVLQQKIEALRLLLESVVPLYRTQQVEIRAVIDAMKQKLRGFLEGFVTHAREEHDQQKPGPKRKPKKRPHSPPPRQRPAKPVQPPQLKSRTPQDRILRVFDKLEREGKHDAS